MSSELDQIDTAMERIEAVILPNVSMMLDTLLDAAELRQAGIGSEAYAAELRTLALQLDTLAKQVEAISLVRAAPRGYSERVA